VDVEEGVVGCGIAERVTEFGADTTGVDGGGSSVSLIVVVSVWQPEPLASKITIKTKTNSDFISFI
jgi:hypothetical protein